VQRTDLDAAAVENQLRSLVTRLDSTIPVYAAVELDRRLADSRAVFSRRLPMALFGVFALSALSLTLVALYSTFAYEVSARRRELGIRAALGATPSLIRRQILRNACGLAGVGIGAGLLGTIVLSGAIQPVLFGIDSRDWRIYLAVAMGALTVAVLSSLGPAMRAGSQGPTTALRQE